ncbi:MAG: RNA polymerase sigma factor [Pirellulales bacterium]
MALSEIDRNLIQRCLAREPNAWQNFVDRYMGLVVHVISHTAQCRSYRLTPEDHDDLAAEVFLALIRDDFAVLRRFRGQSSLATYLTVVARRVVVHQLLSRKMATPLSEGEFETLPQGTSTIQQVADREQVEQLLEKLDGTEATVVRMYHLEGKSYREISHAVGMSENSVGPTLSRARSKMRAADVDQTTGNPQ